MACFYRGCMPTLGTPWYFVLHDVRRQGGRAEDGGKTEEGGRRLLFSAYRDHACFARFGCSDLFRRESCSAGLNGSPAKFGWQKA